MKTNLTTADRVIMANNLFCIENIKKGLVDYNKLVPQQKRQIDKLMHETPEKIKKLALYW